MVKRATKMRRVTRTDKRGEGEEEKEKKLSRGEERRRDEGDEGGGQREMGGRHGINGVRKVVKAREIESVLSVPLYALRSNTRLSYESP